MTPPIGFDPGARMQRADGHNEPVEVTLWQRDDGTWQLAIEHADESTDEITLRPRFLSDLAQARAREAQDAA